jgi:hypothetical protein
VTGDAVVYSAGGGTPVGGLVDGGTYYVVMTGPHSFRLAATKCQAAPTTGGCPGAVLQTIDLTPSAATGRGHSFVRQGTQPPGDPARARHPRADAGARHGLRCRRRREQQRRDPRGGRLSPSPPPPEWASPGNVNVVTATTDAFIGRAALVNADNTGAAPWQSVTVAAGGRFRQLMVGAAVGGGMAGVAVNAAVDVVTLHTRATIGDAAVVRAADSVLLNAQGSEDITAVSASAGRASSASPPRLRRSSCTRRRTLSSGRTW